MPGRFRRPRPETDEERDARLAGTIVNGHWEAVQILEPIELEDLEPAEKIAYAQTLAILALTHRLDRLGKAANSDKTASSMDPLVARLADAIERIANFGVPPPPG
ncbi:MULTISPECIES: hypothetical protein [unclassified Pseudofrankia]|uniref:hypothetical protein n=1 Tax=unclassified Pseudofrankia TaxID=2994372 RepID=UPI0008D9F04A|nr:MULTISPECIES: hypothetical protein [unclassified Pseudofrankia]MDT3443341.1 hypothetical protein [Pseudofrankia sp. BMG5.37]OHV65330.1 hypothetical protein BCD48_04380 [Pseudofrankia sp. BMG5.36]